ncbi:transcriptional regulator family: Fungal Specific TF [Penicillium psychrosexuale]|uniref:transcriptional regulator family: Fungal Specific TF n=1 Tax=Penicillium psychrosexuale TaxID=1002107 RepID=UPI0025455F9B|nr:transcriptional regulator family: Fungal Specific TF [Penicillium psychrosexuale]KAJ5804438.1 transcriptional regulator family: Fungal Specific TF [Penicillium psychrosexuale]
MEKKMAQMSSPLTDGGPLSFGGDDQQAYTESSMGGNTVVMNHDSGMPQQESDTATSMPGNLADLLFPEPPAPPPPPCFVDELKTLSLEATAERHLGSTSGISFARLTQVVLRRLTPDKADFTFVSDRGTNYAGAPLFDFNSPSDLLDPSLFEGLNESVSTHPLLFGDVVVADITGLSNDVGVALDLPSDQSHIDQLVNFYFAHSHTLYPILHRGEFLQSLQRLRDNPHDAAACSPLTLFRIWMVLAVGSTAYCSVSLSEESESRVYYTKALQYFEQAIAYGEMAALEAIMLQVSYSFFNQLGPNTWYLVGMAARLAVGMGLHSSSIYAGMPVDMEQRRKRIFFSIYMMDRVVSNALGRPFALHDDDINITPFVSVDDENITPDGIRPPSSLEPSLMAIPLHILALRRIAGKITRQVYSNRQAASLNTEQREAILHSLHKELIDWRRDMPFPLPDVNDQVPHLCTSWFDFNYYYHLAMLYRPSPLLPTMDRERVKTLAEAASMSIRQAFNLHRQHRLAYNWLNLLALFTATLSRIYSTTVLPENLVTILKETRAIEDLDLAIALFDTLGVKFPAANKIRGMIAEISRRYKDLRDSG